MKYSIALAGNPNVGKSTIFNALTGLHQHTGNWPGKTVCNAVGECSYDKLLFDIYDLPGTYSLIAHSEEELVARDYICFGGSKAVIVVCDASVLERNLNLVLQTIEINPNVVVCVNLLDEAKKKKIEVDLEKLSNILGVPVVGTTARSGKGLTKLMSIVSDIATGRIVNDPYCLTYHSAIEKSMAVLVNYLDQKELMVSSRWLAIRLLSGDEEAINSVFTNLHYDINQDKDIMLLIDREKKLLEEQGICSDEINDYIVNDIVHTAADISKEVVTYHKEDYNKRMRKIDRILTSKITGIPIMLLMLMGIFWLTIVGSNYPSQILYDWLFRLEDVLFNFLGFLPSFLREMLVHGVYRTVAWVVAVMLPPMAIFFPLFTILEDLGYLPRIAFNLDKYFKKCSACGKQALCMCMGFGCNAVGVTGTRIIDSKRERLIAILTNCFVPCNGRFPTIIAIITMFFIGTHSGFGNSLLSSFILILVVLIGIFVTFIISKILSKTILKGVPSSFTLELPPYRRPQIFKVIGRSIVDRTMHVLGRAVAIAAPAGLIIFLLSNVMIGESSILNILSNFLDPFGKFIGMDGVILLAFVLGFPANEIVIPIMLMAYLNTGTLVDYDSLSSLKMILVDNGWTMLTAVCVILFSLLHFPCSTTCLTIKKETNSWYYTLLSFLIPTIVGVLVCLCVTVISRFLLL